MGNYPPISATSEMAHGKCARMWGYSDKDWGMGYVRYIQSVPILVGNLFHYALHLHTLDVEYDQAFKQAVKDVGQELNITPDDPNWYEALHLAESMIHGYAKWQASDASYLADRNLSFLVSEYRFSIELDGFEFRGTWDGACTHTQTGELWVFETKTTTKNFDQFIAGLEKDTQPRRYVAALERILNTKVAGVIYNLVRRTDPTQIKLLASGLPSVSKDTLDGTTYEIYRDLLMQHFGGNPFAQKYEDALTYLQHNTHNMFRRVAMRMSDAHKKSAIKNAVQRAKQMVRDVELGFPANYNRYVCGYCPYKYVCDIQDESEDWQGALATAFVSAKSRPNPVEVDVDFIGE
jgi:hypothetical protein